MRIYFTFNLSFLNLEGVFNGHEELKDGVTVTITIAGAPEKDMTMSMGEHEGNHTHEHQHGSQ